MNPTDIQILVKLKDEASAAFQSMGKSLQKSANDTKSSFAFLNTDVTGLTHALAGIAVAGGATAIAFLYSTVKAAQESQVAIASVDATLKVMGKSAMANRDAILAASNAAVKLGFDDEDSALSITKFYQRTNDLTQAIKLSNVAMDLARAKNLDLGTATNLVNLALSGSGRVLEQYGIKLKDTAGPLEALQDLQKQVAGQASAFAGSFSGEMQVLAVSWQNIKENIGGALLNALQPFIEQFTAWLTNPETQKSFAKWTADFQSWAEVIIPVVIGVFQLWANVLEGIYNTLMKIGNAVMTVTNGLGNFYDKASSGIGAAGPLGGINMIINKLSGRASGGTVHAGTPYMVGENGREMFVPGQDGRIVPAGSVGGQGGIQVSISGNFYGSDELMSEKMGNTIAKIIGQQLKVRVI